MNTTSRTHSQNRNAGRPVVDIGSQMIEQNFEGLSQQALIVEHATIPGFLRRIDHRWNIEDIRRFGDKVRHMAEAMELAYLTTTDAALGVLRTFPVPLLCRVYTILRGQNGWPELSRDERQAEGQRLKEAIRDNERIAKYLRDLVAQTDDTEQLGVLTASIELIEKKVGELRARAATA